MTHLMVMSPPSAKPILVLSFDFGLIGSELSLVEIQGIDYLPPYFEVCPAHKTRQRSSAWALLVGKHQQNQNFTYSFLTLGTLNKIKLMLCALLNYNMGGTIRRLNTNVAFKYIWPKGLNCLTHGRIVYLYIMYQTLHDYDYHLQEIGCAIFQLIWLKL